MEHTHEAGHTGSEKGVPLIMVPHKAGALTSCFLLLALLALEHRVRNPHPRVVLSELWEQVVGDESHCACQGKEHDAEKRLRRRKRSRVNEDMFVNNA